MEESMEAICDVGMARECWREVRRYLEIHGMHAQLPCSVRKTPGESLYVDGNGNKKSQWFHIETSKPVTAEKIGLKGRELKGRMLIQVSGKELTEPYLVRWKNAAGRVEDSRLYFRWTAGGVEEEASILRFFGDGSGEEACEAIRNRRMGNSGTQSGAVSRRLTAARKRSAGDSPFTIQQTCEGGSTKKQATADDRQAMGMSALSSC